ncbi:TrkA family potassium uptake protein [bacterium]|nr:TrkA family potassium uptake protein [bacterium]
MKLILIGSGNMLFFLFRNFTAKGYHVTIINRSQSECIRLARLLPTKPICGDGSDASILQEAGALEADALLAITPNDQDNLVICQLAILKFGIPKVVALANDPENEHAFETLGISAFSTTKIISSLIEQKAIVDQIVTLQSVGEGRVNVTEIVIDESFPFSGRKLKEINLPDNSLVAVLIRNNQPIVPRGETEINFADRVVLISLPENHGAVIKLFSGEK